MTEEEYLAFERATQFKHEFRSGEVFDMTGASERHNLISGSTYVAVYSKLVSLQEYVLMSQVSPHVERFTRQNDD